MSTRSCARRIRLFLPLCAFLGCFGSGRAYQLYAGPPADPGAVARLTGHVQTVDGKDISKHGRSFELLPGCHVITTPRTWGNVTELGGVVANIGTLVYAIPMRAGYSYSIEVHPGPSAGTPQSVRISAKEIDSTGKVTGTFSPSPDDLSCQGSHRDGKDATAVVPGMLGG